MFWHILTKLAYYRELTLRIDQLAAKGLLDPAALAAAASSGVVSENACLVGWGGVRGAVAFGCTADLDRRRALEVGSSQEAFLTGFTHFWKRHSTLYTSTATCADVLRCALWCLCSAIQTHTQVPDVEELLDKAPGKGASGGGTDHPGHPAAAAGASGGGSADGTAHGQPGMPMNEVDTFGAKLNSILAADLTAVALAQGSLDTIPLGPLATLMPLLQMAGQLNDPTIKSALKQVR